MTFQPFEPWPAPVAEPAAEPKWRVPLVLSVFASLLIALGGTLAFLPTNEKIGEAPTASGGPSDVASGGQTAAPPAIPSTPLACDPERRSPARTRRPTYSAPPPMQIDPAKQYTATIETFCGKIVIALDAKAAPQTVNNFVVLARAGFYDGLTWHRVVKDFVVQGGDPEGTGAGGPGYTFPDELNPAGRYPIGTVAMANAGPDTNGSQFFVVVGNDAATLPPLYTIFGTVTEGIEVAQAFELLAGEAERPALPLYMF